MTLPVFISDEPLSVGQIAILDSDEGRHAVTVRRIQVGEQIELVDGLGTRATCEVVETSKRGLTARVDSVTSEPLGQPNFTVVQALAKGERSDLALEILTEVGVDQIIPWSATHSIAKWDETGKGLTKWRRTVREASKQSRRARFPIVAELHNLDQVVQKIQASNLAIVLHESATDRLADAAVPTSGEVLLIVGPEGGISDSELAIFASAGAKILRMGDSVMRTSTAGGVGLAVLISQTNRWSSNQQ